MSRIPRNALLQAVAAVKAMDDKQKELLADELFRVQPTWFTPFFRLGTDEGIDLTKSGGDAERWMNEIEPSLVRIHAYWKEKRVNQPAALLSDDYHHRGRQKEFPQVVRGGPKIGRNEPCPCGSGKKFKKCCGTDGAPPTVH